MGERALVDNIVGFPNTFIHQNKILQNQTGPGAERIEEDIVPVDSKAATG